jgi:hypothetical protein
LKEKGSCPHRGWLSFVHNGEKIVQFVQNYQQFIKRDFQKKRKYDNMGVLGKA